MNTTTVNVFQHNFEEVKQVIQCFLPTFSYVGMDVEFPGDPVKTDDKWMIPNRSQEAFEIMKANCDATNPIVIGLSLWDSQQRYCYNANFNLHFDKDNEVMKEGSFEYLEKRGMDLSLNKTKGISHKVFNSFLWSVGLLKNPKLYWVTFQGSRDLAYLLKLATLEYKKIENVKQFNFLVQSFFPRYIDLKHLITSCNQFSLFSRTKLKYICYMYNVDVIDKNCPASDDAYMTVGLYKHISTYMMHIDMAQYEKTLWNMESDLEPIKQKKLHKNSVKYDSNKSCEIQENPHKFITHKTGYQPTSISFPHIQRHQFQQRCIPLSRFMPNNYTGMNASSYVVPPPFQNLTSLTNFDGNNSCEMQEKQQEFKLNMSDFPALT